MDRLFNFIVLAQANLQNGGGSSAGSAPGAAAVHGASAAAGHGATQGNGIEPILFTVLMLVVFYFLLIRPQQKRAKKHRRLVKALKPGDTVITTSGIFGKIIQLDETTATLEIAKGTRVKVVKNYVGGLATAETQQELSRNPPT